MNRIIQASESEILDLIRQAVRLELKDMLPAQKQESESPSGTRKEVAAYLKVSISTLDTMTRTGELKSFRIGRQVRYKWIDINEYLSSK